MRNLDGQLITIFGGSGFVGRYVVQRLLSRGARVRLAEREPRKALFLKPLGGLGQTQFVAADVRDAASVSRAVAGSDAVINLVGSFDDMFAVQADGAAHIAAAVNAAGIPTLVHISAIGADANSPSNCGQSKSVGEAAVRITCPGAVILRPSIIFGREDQFINRFAALIRMLPVVPVIAPNAKFQPVYVGDVADAVVAALDTSAAGQTFELGGPQQFSMAGLLEWIGDATGRNRLFAPIPDAVASPLARGFGWMPGAPITKDQWLMLQSDNIVADGAAGLADLGVTPTALAAVADGWLVQYRRNGRFAQVAAH